MMAMNKRIKQRWIKALRGGRYKQGKGCLKQRLPDGPRHCCLGVLEELAVKDGVIKRITGMFLTKKVQKWAGLDGQNPTLGTMSAAFLNDDANKSFDFIANRIEKYL